MFSVGFKLFLTGELEVPGSTPAWGVWGALVWVWVHKCGPRCMGAHKPVGPSVEARAARKYRSLFFPVISGEAFLLLSVRSSLAFSSGVHTTRLFGEQSLRHILWYVLHLIAYTTLLMQHVGAGV